MKFGGIGAIHIRKCVNSWHMEDNFVERIALAAIICPHHGVFHNIYTVAGTGCRTQRRDAAFVKAATVCNIPTRGDLERTGLGRIQFETGFFGLLYIVEADIRWPFKGGFFAS